MRRRFCCPAVMAAALAAALGAVQAEAAEGRHTIRDSRHLWATVNVCDTLAHPDAIGIRGSMPGTGRRHEQMYMRFQIQYFRASDALWHNITRGGDSGFVRVGSSMFKARQAGRLFIFAPPAGGSWQLRGVVTFEWRLGKRTLLRVRERTTAGHNAAEADPPGYSSDTCVIS